MLVRSVHTSHVCNFQDMWNEGAGAVLILRVKL